MKYRILNALFVFACIILVYACASQKRVEDLGSYWIARPLSELKQEMKSPDSYASRTGWKETTYALGNGDSVYVQPVASDCEVHWEVNRNGIIIGYQAKGKGCKGEGLDTSILHTQMKEY